MLIEVNKGEQYEVVDCDAMRYDVEYKYVNSNLSYVCKYQVRGKCFQYIHLYDIAVALNYAKPCFAWNY